MNNGKRNKFVELANKRVNKAIHTIHSIGNLSNKSNYDYSDEDIMRIFKALEAELKNCRSLFEKHGQKDAKTFLLE